MAYPGSQPGGEQQPEQRYQFQGEPSGQPPVAGGYVPIGSDEDAASDGYGGHYQVDLPGSQPSAPQFGVPSSAPPGQPSAVPFPAPPDPPMSGTPMSGSPMSASPFPPSPVAATSYLGAPPPGPALAPGAPVASGPMLPGSPAFGMPPQSPPGQPAPAGKTPAIVAAVLAALFFIATGAMTALYVTKNNELAKSERTVSQRDDTISSQSSEITRLKQDLARVNDELEQAETDLAGSENQTAELKRQKQVISNCLGLLGAAAQAAEAGDTATAKAKQAEAQPVCDEASRYLQ